jgi:hypothetical protein
LENRKEADRVVWRPIQQQQLVLIVVIWKLRDVMMSKQTCVHWVKKRMKN